jgi:hypothetical protein
MTLETPIANYALVNDYNEQADPRMARIDQVIVTVDVVDIDVIVVVIPVGWPRFGVLEIIAAVIKPAIIAAAHVEMMFAAETGAELFVPNTPAASALSGVAAVAVLFGLLRALLVLGTILLLRGLGLIIAIAVILLRPIILLARAIVLLRRLGSLSILLLFVRFLLGFGGGLLLVLLAFIWLFALLGLFLSFWFFLRLIFIGFLPRIARGAEKEYHHRCTKDELHFNSSVFCFANDRACVVGNTTKSGLAGMVTFSTPVH